MKKFYFILSLVLGFSFSQAQNLVNNGGMESWTDSVIDIWTSEEGTTISQETSIVSEGSSAAKFHVTTGTQGSTDFRQSISVEIGKTYTVSVDVYQMDATSKARVYANGFATYSDPELVNQWQTLTAEFTAEATGEAQVGLRFYDLPDVFNPEVGSMVIADNYTVTCTDCNSTEPALFVTSPSNNTVFPVGTTDVTVEFTTDNFQIGATDAGLDGHLHYTVNGGSMTMYYSNDPIQLTGLAAGEYTVNLWLVDNAHQSLDPEVAANVTFTIPTQSSVANIAELRAGNEGNIYTLTGEAILTMQQDFRGQKWIEDQTGAILIDDNNGVITTTYNRYDGITGITGTLASYNGTMQFLPSEDPGAASSTGNTIEPQVITVSAFNANPEMYQSELVKFENVTYSGDATTWENGSNYTFTASDVPEDALAVRTNFYNVDYIGTDVPTARVHLVGIAGAFNGTAQMYPRDNNDIITGLAVNDLTLDLKAVKVAVANNVLNVKGFDAKQVKIYNVNGVQVANNTFVGNLNAGVYIAVMINEEGQTVNVKFIKK